ncbi:hypothetical protein Q8F55_008048 [Vanrija albida]|uniref:DNA (cytosine-5-)-methyltransferase n=1 Tax=Vanrija albida TaxID=181172 RepID=A0ABR3PV60_9TREE
MPRHSDHSRKRKRSSTHQPHANAAAQDKRPQVKPPRLKAGAVVLLRRRDRPRALALVRNAGERLHVQLARRSELLPGEVLLLPSCADVSPRAVVRVVRARARWAFDAAQLAWSDAGACACAARRGAAAEGAEVVDGVVIVGGEAAHPGDLVFLRSDGPAALGVLTRRACTVPSEGPSAGTLKIRRLGRVVSLPGAVGVSERRLYLTDTVARVPLADVLGRGELNAATPESFTCAERLANGRPHHYASLTPATLTACAPCSDAAATAAAENRAFASLRLNTADLYAGGGGSVLGALRGGWSVRHAVDADPVCSATLAANAALRGVGVREMSVAAYTRTARPGKIALVFAGPPCQGHSGANRHRAPHDPRNLELYAALSAIARLHPDAAVLENVPRAKDEHGSVNYAREAVARLLTMGYQARVALLDAASYGAPQARVRLFILAARRGLPLPRFPAPTHAAAQPRTLLHLDGEAHALVPGACAAPLPAISAAEVISDLPPFEIPRAAGGAEYRWSEWRGHGQALGFPRPVPYARAPANDFQRAMRADRTRLRDHVIRPPADAEVDVIREAFRVDGHTLPVAERKRFQGFPDDYRFVGGIKAANTMLGNAVAVPVAEAICRQIKSDLYFDFWRAEGKPDTKTFWRRWRKAHPVLD